MQPAAEESEIRKKEFETKARKEMNMRSLNCVKCAFIATQLHHYSAPSFTQTSASTALLAAFASLFAARAAFLAALASFLADFSAFA